MDKPRRRRPLIERFEPRMLLSTTIYVDANASSATHDGTSWPTAFTDLQQALAIATAGDEIHVADGVYKPTSGTNTSSVFILKDATALLGGFAGDGAPNPDERDISKFQTTLSGDIGTPGNAADNALYVVRGSQCGPSTLIDGFSITAAATDGLYNVQSSLRISNCTLLSNAQGIYNSNSSPRISDCTFIGNGAPIAWGGGIYNYASSPMIEDCRFERNTAIYGGALTNYGGSSSQSLHCVFIENSATQYGGAVYNSTSAATFKQCQFMRNVAMRPDGLIGDGGGIYIDTSSRSPVTPTVRDCTFNGNSAVRGSGIFSSYGGQFVNCVFSGNFATDRGSGIFGLLGPTQITNCTFAENTGTWGSTVYCVSGTLTNSIVWGSTSSSGSAYVQTANYSDFKLLDGSGSGGNRGVDPLFVRPPNAGPDKQWGTVDDDYGNLRLRPYSPVCDAGKNAAVPADVLTDVDANPRFQDIPTTSDQGSGTAPIVDMGAYETTASLSGMLDGPYAVIQGKQIILHGFGASDVGPAVKLDWEWSGDGLFDDATGPSPTFTDTNGLPRVINVQLRVTDSAMQSIVLSTTLRIVPPVIYVDPRATGVPDGRDWDNAYTNLTAALNDAIAGVSIRVAQGTYTPTTTSDRHAAFTMKTSVHLYGGYAGLTMADPNDRKPDVYSTIISGDIGVFGDNSDNSYHVVYSPAGITDTSLEGFVVTRGNADGAGEDALGGGMYNPGGSYVRGCKFIANRAYNGGGLYGLAPYPMAVVNSIFVGNVAFDYGGGLYAFNGEGYACDYVSNYAGKAGGGVYVPTTTSLTPVTYSIVWANSSPQLYLGRIVNLSLAGSGFGGGGVYTFSQDPQFSRLPSVGADGTWGTPDDDYGDLRLRITSPCLDVPRVTGPTTDITGDDRNVDLSRTMAGRFMDMGAYEHQLTSATGKFIPDAPHPVVQVEFDVDLDTTTLTADDLSLVNLTTGETIDVASKSIVTYDPATRSARWVFSAPLPDGNYRGFMQQYCVFDTINQSALLRDLQFDFVSLAGDANGDRSVNAADLAILAMNWGGSGRVFSQGDFNYDTKVDAADLAILSRNWQKSVWMNALMPAPPVVRAPTRTPVRVVTLVL